MDSKFIELIEKIEIASSTITKYFGKALKYEEKSMAADIRSKADTETEAQVIEAIQEIFPDFGIYGEESGHFKKAESYFIIDPLDGTNNFSMGIPIFCTSVALVTNNEIIFGVTHQPILKQTFYAYKGEGAFYKDKKITVNDVKESAKSSISYTCGYAAGANAFKTFIKLEQLNCKRIGTFWCPTYDYCLLASGKIEAVVNENNELYDYAAGKIIATEAGAKITDFEGNKDQLVSNSRFIASNGKIHDQIVNIINTK